ncbi:DMT family transporter [Octadecabacter sp. 1_MG-2023]|uniref:DMT family transporter n=1 Tax=unclassified Octadecabacter TaxID=196158 RepID=UPI001C0903EA|nr:MULTISPECIES: DMT family transporter [unclassified Octadecabacter]MBU2994731.1 DMT family transporter [Octadecabacter sp. B2R22]MDO6733975.1 DMT family transporter [Octadecabacter sp. 1_MG-2023]
MQTIQPKLSMICTLCGMFVLGVTDNLVPLISQISSLWLFQLARSAAVVPMLIVLTLLGLGTLRANRPRWVLARNFFTGSALLIYFGCLAILPIGVVVAGMFTAPIFVLLLSVLFRGEKVGIWRWASVAVGFVGAVMVVWPEDGALTALSFVPIIAGVFYAIGAVGTRDWCEGESVLVMTLAYFAILGIYGAIGMIALTLWPLDLPQDGVGWLYLGWVPMTPTVVWVTVAQAVGSLIGVGLLTRGYQLGEASYVAINEYSLIVFSASFAWLIWDQTVGVVALFGMALIILSGSIIAVRSK